MGRVPTVKKSVEQRRAEILDVTCEVVVERGFGSTRIADVAERLGVSTGLIHYHFATKDVLLTEMLRTEAERDIAKARRMATGHHDGGHDRPAGGHCHGDAARRRPRIRADRPVGTGATPRRVG